MWRCGQPAWAVKHRSAVSTTRFRPTRARTRPGVVGGGALRAPQGARAARMSPRERLRRSAHEARAERPPRTVRTRHTVKRRAPARTPAQAGKYVSPKNGRKTFSPEIARFRAHRLGRVDGGLTAARMGSGRRQEGPGWPERCCACRAAGRASPGMDRARGHFGVGTPSLGLSCGARAEGHDGTASCTARALLRASLGRRGMKPIGEDRCEMGVTYTRLQFADKRRRNMIGVSYGANARERAYSGLLRSEARGRRPCALCRSPRNEQLPGGSDVCAR